MVTCFFTNLNKYGPALWLDAWTNGKRGEEFPGTEYQERMIQTDETGGSQRSTERAGFRRMGHVFVTCKFDSSLACRWKSVICLICARTSHLILDTRPSELIIKENTTVSKCQTYILQGKNLDHNRKVPCWLFLLYSHLLICIQWFVGLQQHWDSIRCFQISAFDCWVVLPSTSQSVRTR